MEVSAWVLEEKRSTFYAARWAAARASFSASQLFPPPARPQVLLRLTREPSDDQRGDTTLVVARAHRQALTSEETDGRARLPLEVRSMEDVRAAQRFHTAAPSRLIDVYVEPGDVARVLAFLADPTAAAAVPAKAADSGVNEVIDRAFAAVERAQREREAGRAARALALFREAERSFHAAAQLLPDERSRELLRSRARDIERAIAGLEEQLKAPVEPSAGPSVQVPTTTRAASVPRQEQEPSSSSAPIDILARLEELRRFAADESAEAKAKSTATEQAPPAVKSAVQTAPDLTARLAALRTGGRSTDTEDLSARLRRLRGLDAEPPAPGAVDLEESSEDEEEAVARVIAMAQDEVALGLTDDEVDALESEDSEDSPHSSFDTSESSISTTSSKSAASSKPK